MKEDMMRQAIGGIDDKLIEDSDKQQNTGRIRVFAAKWGAVAACLIIIAVAGITVGFNKSGSDKQISFKHLKYTDSDFSMHNVLIFRDIETKLIPFEEDLSKGSMVRIIPEKYECFLERKEDDDVVSSYAECSCVIKAVSSASNVLNFSVGQKITVRQDIVFAGICPTEEEANNFEKNVLSTIVTIVDGEVLPGKYKIPEKHLNKFEILFSVNPTDLPLCLDEEYYALVIEENGELRFMFFCPEADGEITSYFDIDKSAIKDYKINTMTGFKEDVKKFSPDIMK